MVGKGIFRTKFAGRTKRHIKQQFDFATYLHMEARVVVRGDSLNIWRLGMETSISFMEVTIVIQEHFILNHGEFLSHTMARVPSPQWELCPKT